MENVHPHSLRLKALWLHGEADHTTCGVFVRQEVGNLIQISGGLL